MDEPILKCQGKCGYEFGTNDYRLYPQDREACEKYIPGYSSIYEYNKLCRPCFEKRDKMDIELYKADNKYIKPISWDYPYGIPNEVNTIIPTKSIKLIIPDDTIKVKADPNYKPPITNDITSFMVDVFANDEAKSKAKKKMNTIEYDAQLLKQDEEYDRKKHEENDKRIMKENLLAEERKRAHNLRRLEKEQQIAAAKEAYPNYKKIKQCKNCDIYKAYPQQFANCIKYVNGEIKYVNGIIDIDEKLENLCLECLNNKTEQKRDYAIAYKKKMTVKCACGMKYIATKYCKAKHMKSELHKKNLELMKSIKHKCLKETKYSRKQLRKICKENGIMYYSNMTRDQMIKNLNELPTIKIPTDEVNVEDQSDKTELKKETMRKYKKEMTIKCPCGMSYFGSKRCETIHMNSDQHKKNLELMNSINHSSLKEVKYNREQLRQICKENGIRYYFNMKKDEMIKKLDELPDIKIPAFKS